MARKVVVELVDDIDGTAFGEDGESISYAVDGVEYVIDLKDEHAKELRETFEYYISHSHPGRGPQTPLGPIGCHCCAAAVGRDEEDPGLGARAGP